MAVLPGRLERSIPQSRRQIAGLDPKSVAAPTNAAIDAAETTGRGAQQIASGLNSMGQSFQRAQDALDENSYLDAKGKFLMAKVEQDNAFDQDPDWGTYEKRYGENLSKVRGELVSGISNSKLRRQFELETKLDLTEGAGRIKAKAWDRETKDGVDNLNLAITENTAAALKARDEPTRTAILNSMNARIDAAAKAQYISGPGAKDLKRKVAAQYAQQSISLLPPSEQLTALIPGVAPSKITQQALPAAKDYAARVLDLESSGGKITDNPKSSAFGKYQWIPSTAAQYGITPDSSDKEQDAAFERFTNDNRTALRSALNREPTPAELYLAHQQGAGGAAALLSNPSQPAIVALTAVYGDSQKAREAILLNGGGEGMTAGQFTSLWSNKFNGGSGEPIGKAISGEVPPGGWDFSQPTGTIADVLEPGVRAEMIAQATKAMLDESKAAREAAQVSIAVGTADANQNAYLTGKADPTYEAQIMAAYPDERGAKMIGEYRQNAQMGADNNLIKGTTLLEDAAMLAGAEAAAMEPGPGSAVAAERYGQIATAIKQKHDALSKNPAGYVIKNDPSAADAFDQIQNLDPKDPEGIMKARLAAETILASQRKFGLSDAETRILPVETAATMAGFIEPKPDQSGEEAVANIQAQAEQWGPYWPKVWSEIAGNVGDAGRMVAVMDPSQNIAAARLIEANQQKDVLEKQTQGEIGTKIKEAVTKSFAEFNETFAHGNALGEALRYQSQGELLTRRYVAVDGMNPDDAAERAYQETIGTVYDTSTGVRIPKRFDVEDVVAGADMAVRNLADIDPVSDDLGAGEQAQQQYLSSIKANHRWVNSPDGLGLSLLDMYDRPVLVGGKPYTVGFDDLTKTEALPATRFGGYGRQ